MKKGVRLLTNKFILTGAAFAIWMFFFDQNDWKAQRQRKHDLEATEKNIAYLNQQISKMEDDYQELTSNPERLEQYAREHYRMKKDNEDVFVIEH